MSQNVVFAFGLTLFAGLATGIGSAIAFFGRRTSKRFLSAALGFSAGPSSASTIRPFRPRWTSISVLSIRSKADFIINRIVVWFTYLADPDCIHFDLRGVRVVV